MEKMLNEGLAMIELEERLEMVQLSSAEASSCCFDSNSGDSAEGTVEVSAARVE
jgi:hypothetical protein